jgi:hypothetical protein
VDPVVERGGVEHAHEAGVLGVRITWEPIANVGTVNSGDSVAHRQTIDHDFDIGDLFVIEGPPGDWEHSVHRLQRTRKLDFAQRGLVEVVVDGHGPQPVVLA